MSLGEAMEPDIVAPKARPAVLLLLGREKLRRRSLCLREVVAIIGAACIDSAVGLPRLCEEDSDERSACAAENQVCEIRPLTVVTDC